MSIRFHPYELPLAIPYRWAKGEQHVRRGIVAHIRLWQGDAMAEGWGECAPPPHEDVDSNALLAEARTLVSGLDPSWDHFLDDLDARDPSNRLRAALSTAWLSARAMAAGQPLSVYLAARLDMPAPADRVGVNGLVTDASPEAAGRTAARLVAAGARTLKVKCTADRAENIARLAAIRVACPQVVLRIDPNEALALEWAADHLSELAEFGIEYAEQPIACHDPETLLALRRESPIPIAADESAKNLAAVEALLAADAVDALILKPQRLGGPDRLLRVAYRAAERGVPSTITNSLETAVGLTAALHIAACLPRPVPDAGLGTARFFARNLAAPPEIVEGGMAIPAAHGLGVAPVLTAC